MTLQPLVAESAAAPLPSLGRRVLHMVALWTYFAFVMGTGMGLMEGDWIGVAAHITAGLAVLPALGCILGLIGGPWREAYLGAVTGCLMGLAAASRVEKLDPIQIGYTCLLVGGLVGATFPENYRRFTRQMQRLVAQVQGSAAQA